ncbi:MAG: ferredoxin family protein [Thermoplasmata archaeon]|nr:MAG: ferredoxin family protein [Thermoplasmata archaeon]
MKLQFTCHGKHKGICFLIRGYNNIKIDYDKCNGAAKCVEDCPVDVYELVDGKAAAPKIDDCIECCVCVSSCPNGAIEHSSC